MIDIDAIAIIKTWEKEGQMLTKDELEAAKLAGKMVKVIRLANSPGMDEVAIKLNCGLTYDEEQGAILRATAFKLAQENLALPNEERLTLFDLTAKLVKIT